MRVADFHRSGRRSAGPLLPYTAAGPAAAKVAPVRADEAGMGD
jgi:hypothetical protein